MPTEYVTLEEAVRAALLEALAISKTFEYGGLVYEQDGQFFYTVPQGQNRRRGQDGFRVTAKIPKGSLRAIYHTHPPASNATRFSAEDIDVAMSIKVPSYIGVQGGELRQFVPGKTKVIDVGFGNRSSLGDPFPEVVGLLEG